jgi:NitT/TauT family transport system substrate-binding protein
MRLPAIVAAVLAIASAVALSVALSGALSGTAARAEQPVLRIAVLKFGTVNWLTDTIGAHALDRAAGYRLDVVELAGRPATTIAFQAGDVDVIVTDWVWALQERDKGRDLRFAPYSNALGAVVTNGRVSDLCDLKGRPVGVVGGERDKSWLVLQALVRRDCGFDLADETTTLTGAAPLIGRQLLDGAVDAVSTYWNHAAELEAGGMARLIGVDEAMTRLGISPAPPLIGFVWDAAATEPGTVAAFLASAAAAQDLLAGSDAEWERLRPAMGAASDAEFRLLRDRFRAGIVRGWRPGDTEAAAKLHRLLVDTADEGFAAEAGTFDPALFEARGDAG